MSHVRGAAQKRVASSHAKTGCLILRSSAERGQPIAKTATAHNKEFARIGIQPELLGRPAATSCRRVIVTAAIREHLAAYALERLLVFMTPELYTR